MNTNEDKSELIRQPSVSTHAENSLASSHTEFPPSYIRKKVVLFPVSLYVNIGTGVEKEMA